MWRRWPVLKYIMKHITWPLQVHTLRVLGRSMQGYSCLILLVRCVSFEYTCPGRGQHAPPVMIAQWQCRKRILEFLLTGQSICMAGGHFNFLCFDAPFGRERDGLFREPVVNGWPAQQNLNTTRPVVSSAFWEVDDRWPAEKPRSPIIRADSFCVFE